MFAWLARRRSWSELPPVAARLGLEYEEAEDTAELGTFKGSYEGHHVLVRPDKPAIVVDYVHRKDGLELSTWSPPRRRHPDVDFESGDAGFDRIFKKRQGGAWAAALRSRPEWLASVVEFRRQHKRVIAQIDLSQVSFSAWFKERGMAISYISAAELEIILPKMTRIVAALDRLTLL